MSGEGAIVVAGFNTALDRRIELDVLRPGEVQRARRVQVTPGGKGVHVAQTVAALGGRVQLVGLIDAPHRLTFERVLHERGVEFHGIGVPAIRHCLALHEADGRSTEVLEPGPALEPAERAALFDCFRTLARRARLVVLSGSLPPGCEDESYADFVRELQGAGVRCLVDASGDALRHALDAAPFLLKPNRDEASALLGRSLENADAAADAVRALARQGVSLPLLSLGAAGALIADGDDVLHAQVDIERAINTVGSGDCLLAGVAVALARGESREAALRLGVACGAANAASDETGYAPRARVDALLPRVRVTRLHAGAPEPMRANALAHAVPANAASFSASPSQESSA